MNIQIKEALLRASLLAGICNCLISPSYGMEIEEERRVSSSSVLFPYQEFTENSEEMNTDSGIVSNFGNNFYSFLPNNTMDDKNNKRSNQSDLNNRETKKQKLDLSVHKSQVICISDSEDESNGNLELIERSQIIWVSDSEDEGSDNLEFIEQNNVNMDVESINHNIFQLFPLDIEDIRTQCLFPILEPQSFGRCQQVCKAWYNMGQMYVQNELSNGKRLIYALKQKNFDDALLYMKDFCKFSVNTIEYLYGAFQIYFSDEKDEDRLFEIYAEKKKKKNILRISSNFLNTIRALQNSSDAHQELERRINIYEPYGFSLLFASRLNLLLPGQEKKISKALLEKRAIEKLCTGISQTLPFFHPLLNSLEKVINSDPTYYQSYRILEVMKAFSKGREVSVYNTRLNNEIKKYALEQRKNAHHTHNSIDFARSGELFELQLLNTLEPSPNDCKNCAYTYYEAARYTLVAADKAYFFGKAAHQNHTESQFQLGFCYAEGLGISKDYVEAMKWYRLAAAQNHANAQNNMGVLYCMGRGVEQNYTEAMKWYKLSADQNNACAQCNIGSFHEFGSGVPINYLEAIRWFRLAAAQNNVHAQSRIEALEKRQSVEMLEKKQDAEMLEKKQNKGGCKQSEESCIVQ